MKRSWPTLACPSGSGEVFWEHQWEKHGTCSESVINQHEYFQTSLKLKQQTNLLGALTKAGINPDGNSYSLESIRDSIKESTGFTPWIECNRDGSGNSQLYQVYLCVDRSASGLIECPVFPRGKCGNEIEFPSFNICLLISLSVESNRSFVHGDGFRLNIIYGFIY
ncbi:ribonuclease 1-like [Raphanus sativus]|uniref:Ribonuclease 1-like n=1 Tax=Raphanus sativus TaxID=3726 RepID=A0A9W3BUP7_RAPSA|nr:ribonuclease 1-like [Raphanus sativus]